MSDDIPFDRIFDLEPGRAEEVAPGVRRIVANNPGPFTFKGTVSYIVGRGKVAIIDPGPDDPSPHQGAARCRARRDRDAHLRHAHASRPFARGAGDQGRDRRDRLCRRPAPRLASAQCRRSAAHGSRRTTWISAPITRSPTATS